jgi:hypothetical protein
MSCKLCQYFGQYALNWLNLIDHAGNCIALGDADETISARVARARRDGQEWAVGFCHFLTLATKIVTFGKVTRDHCEYALDKKVRPNSREIFSLSTMSFNPTPVSEVRVIETEKRQRSRKDPK